MENSETAASFREETGEGTAPAADDNALRQQEHEIETGGGYATTFESAENDISKMRDTRDSLSEQGEAQQLRMQMIMERMTKADSAASNALKKFGEVASQIIGNWK